MTDCTIEPTETVSATQVADYLTRHPEFFVEYQHLLADLVLPHASGSAASLVERQAQVMRDRNSELRQRLNNLIDTARENDNIFQLSKNLGLALMEASTLEAAARAIHHSLHKEFKVDCASLILFDTPEVSNKGFINQTSKEAAKRVLGNLIRNEGVHCSALREEEFRYLFPTISGKQGTQQGSAAIVTLYFKRELGILAVGNHNPSHFETSMDTSFLDYIGQIVSRRLDALLKLETP